MCKNLRSQRTGKCSLSHHVYWFHNHTFMVFLIWLLCRLISLKFHVICLQSREIFARGIYKHLCSWRTRKVSFSYICYSTLMMSFCYFFQAYLSEIPCCLWMRCAIINAWYIHWNTPSRFTTVETLYSTIYYSQNFIELNIDKSTQYVALWTHKRHPIPRPFGRAMECLLWVLQQKLIVL